jgi:hypothetical protein
MKFSGDVPVEMGLGKYITHPIFKNSVYRCGRSFRRERISK